MDINLDVAKIRKTHGMTQHDLAVQAGVDDSTVWRWENEGVPTRGPARAYLERLAKERPQQEQAQ